MTTPMNMSTHTPVPAAMTTLTNISIPDLAAAVITMTTKSTASPTAPAVTTV